MSFTLPKKEKLKSKKLIERLFAEGKSVSNYPVKLIYLKTLHADGSKIKTGVTASKRNFKSAVNRNRIKRLMRECYRLNKPLFFNNIVGDYAFMFLYLGKDMPTYEQLEACFKLVIKKILIKENHEKVD
ncbi:MAG: ribonuclease P protein component [Psychroserpens sp.]|jgi:ribonuclease P protein component